MDTLDDAVSTDSDRKPGANERLGAQSGAEIIEATSEERATHPEFALRMRAVVENAAAPAGPATPGVPASPARGGAPNTIRQAIQPAFSVEAADRYADSIRPSWDEPSFRTLRPLAANRVPERDPAPSGELAADSAAAVSASTPPPRLSAAEADAYAARIQPSWAPPAAWSAPSVLPETTLMTEGSNEQSDHDWVEPERTRVLRAALIAAGFAVLGAAVGALLALAPRFASPAPAMERTKLSALTAETSASAANRRAAPPPTAEVQQPSAAATSSDTIRVRIAAEPARAKIVLDGVEVPNPFDDRRLKGGKHRVLIRAKGRATRDLTLTFERDEFVRLTLEPLPPSGP